MQSLGKWQAGKRVPDCLSTAVRCLFFGGPILLFVFQDTFSLGSSLSELYLILPPRRKEEG